MSLSAELLRHRSPQDGNFLPNLGKTLTHHQVLPATMANRVANAPRTDFGKAVLSSMGGNPRAVNQAVQGIRAQSVKQVSHFDRRQMLAKGVGEALKQFPHHKSLISH